MISQTFYLHGKSHSSSVNDEKTNDTYEMKNDDRSGGETDGEDLPLSSSLSAKDLKEKECAPLSPIPSATCSNLAVSDEPPPLSPQQPTSVAVKKERISKKLCKELNACKVRNDHLQISVMFVRRSLFQFVSLIIFFSDSSRGNGTSG